MAVWLARTFGYRLRRSGPPGVIRRRLLRTIAEPAAYCGALRLRREALVGPLLLLAMIIVALPIAAAELGREVSIERHLQDGEEARLPLRDLLEHGRRLFSAVWTAQEGGGRPLSKGTGADLTDPASPLLFPRNFNRLSAPDANSCAGCHNSPFGIAGGGGDVVTNVFVLGQRFDFVTFDLLDGVPTRGSTDEAGLPSTLQTIANSRNTLGMFGSGFIEMLARQITGDLQQIRDGMAPGESRALRSKGIDFGWLQRLPDGSWDSTLVEGLPAMSLASSGPIDPPSLIIRPFHQAGAVVSLRQFTNNAFNHHHGMQAAERFGDGTDADGDGFADELTRADITAVTLYQAALAVPGRVIADDPEVAAAVAAGEQLFEDIGCGRCHIPRLPLDNRGWIYTEPNPYNPAGNLRSGEGVALAMDLTSRQLPGLRPQPDNDGIVWVAAFTDFKLHDITSGDADPNREPLDQNAAPGSPAFFAGNGHFLTRKLWGAANEPPYFHHGQFTTLREAVLAHDGEALPERRNFEGLAADDRNALIEFLKSLQVLPPAANGRHNEVRQQPGPASRTAGR